MSKKNSFLEEHEKQANKLAAQVMHITFLIFTLVYILNIVGVFDVNQTIMTVAYILGSLLLVLPTLLIMKFKVSSSFVKYFVVIGATCFVTMLCITLTKHVVAFYVYPIAIASLYFSKKVNVFSAILTVLGVSIGQIAGFLLHTVQDHNFTDMKKLIIFGVIPRALILVALAAIFTSLGTRTSAMLSSLMGAEEQKSILRRMQRMKENATKTSNVLYDMVTELSGITENSTQANEMIAQETDTLLEGTTANTKAVEKTNQRLHAITEKIVGLSELNHETARLTGQIEVNTQENQDRMDEATDRMEQIFESTNECKQIIFALGEASKEIIGIVQTITSISSKTSILALNASIEAARAGEHGKGFAVVAEEIQKLSEQTKSATGNITTIVNDVVRNMDRAVVSMEQNATYTQNGMESIQKANESATTITDSNRELAQRIREIDEMATMIREKSGEVADAMEQISHNTRQNCTAVEQITAATEENSAGVLSLSDFVEHIRESSEQLNELLQE